MKEQQLRDVVIGALTEVAPDVDPLAIDPDSDLAEQLETRRGGLPPRGTEARGERIIARYYRIGHWKRR